MNSGTKMFLVPVFLVLGISGGLALGRYLEKAPSTDLPAVPRSAAELQDAFAATAEFSMRSVVHITTARQRSSEFFGSQENIGSGVIVSREGHILTNNHVVEGARAFVVRFVDGSEYSARIVGTDPETDLALIKIDLEVGVKLQPAVIGDSDKMRVGDWVLAIGSPFGYNHTVTAGIVSAKHRQANMKLLYQDFLQTDAAINPGNSGGALVNLKGEVIGINTAIISGAKRNAGVGLAISSNLAKWVLERLMRGGKVRRGYLGLVPYSINRELVKLLRLPDVESVRDLLKRLGMDEPRGAYVGRVEPDTPAWQAGIRAGDVILEFSGGPVRDQSDIFFKVAQADPGSKVKVRVLRDGKPRVFEVELAERPQLDFYGRPQK